MEVAMSVTIKEVQAEANNQPNTEAYPISDPQFRHKISAAHYAKHRDQREPLDETECGHQRGKCHKYEIGKFMVKGRLLSRSKVRKKRHHLLSVEIKRATKMTTKIAGPMYLELM